MNAPLAVLNTALVSSVGLSAPAACAAIRAGVTNPSETRFLDAAGEWIVAQQVPLEEPWRGQARLVKMAVMAITESLANVPREDWPRLPLLLCVAERERPGRLAGLDDGLFHEIQRQLGVEFAEHSLVIPQGRVSASIALMHARRLITQGQAPLALIAAVDSLVTWPALKVYDGEQRLLRSGNSDGFIPGEGAGALLVGPAGSGPQLVCTGLGFASEPAHIRSAEPLRAAGLSRAIGAALADAGCELRELDFRITDISGEQFYFKEAALALARTARARKADFDIWHPAECIGETGAVAGVALLVVADAATRKAYAPGPGVLCHAANDAGHRAAAVFRFQSGQFRSG
jgi:3-oxoacyl-[acyl-carrier-protein] synthase I